jgi:hypothetical protein
LVRVTSLALGDTVDNQSTLRVRHRRHVADQVLAVLVAESSLSIRQGLRVP